MDKKRKRKATKGQRDRIENMLRSGLIDRDEAQEIISPLGPPVDIRRLHGWEPPLNAELPDLESRARKAIFWREFKSVRVFPASKRTELESSIWLSVGDALKSPLYDMVGIQFANRSFQEHESVWKPIWHSLGLMQWTSIFLAAGFAQTFKPREAEKLQPFLELCLAGNLPWGTDTGQNLLVLVAD